MLLGITVYITVIMDKKETRGELSEEKGKEENNSKMLLCFLNDSQSYHRAGHNDNY